MVLAKCKVYETKTVLGGKTMSSMHQVCASVGQMADSAWESTKSAGNKVGNFCGRAVTKVSEFWHSSVLPFLQRMVDTAKGFFGKAKDWAEANPDTLRAVVITGVASIVVTGIFMRFCCNGNAPAAAKGDEAKDAKKEVKA